MSTIDLPYRSADRSGRTTELDPQRYMKTSDFVNTVTDVLGDASRDWILDQRSKGLIKEEAVRSRKKDVRSLINIGYKVTDCLDGGKSGAAWRDWYRDQMSSIRASIKEMVGPKYQELLDQHEGFCDVVFNDTSSRPNYSDKFYAQAPALLSIDSNTCRAAQKVREKEVDDLVSTMQTVGRTVENELGEMEASGYVQTSREYEEVLANLRAEQAAILSAESRTSTMQKGERLAGLLASGYISLRNKVLDPDNA